MAVLIVRIKQAECALADGRLDEAYELLSAEEMRRHRRGQDLAGELARALVKRGRAHLESGRLTQAGGDCDKAGRLAGNLPEIGELRSAISDSLLGREQAEKQQADAIAAARQHIERGQLSIGQRLLGGIEPANGAAAALMRDVAQRRTVIEVILEKAGDALKRDDWEAAIDELARADGAQLSDARLRELVGRTVRAVVQRTEAALQSGRLDMAAALLRRLSRIADESVETEHLHRALEQCRAIWKHVEEGRPREAEEIARRLAVVLPRCEWLAAASKGLRQASEALDELRAGPFGLLAGEEYLAPVARRRPLDETVSMASAPRRVPAGGSTPEKLILQVDGVGSFLVLRQKRITIGPISSSHACDVGLLVEPHAPRIAIERMEDDYFLRCTSPVKVNDRTVPGKLLAGGDRIELSPRLRMAFRLPSAASTSAVLDLHAARLPRGDVRHIILLDRELILGPGPSAHIRCDDMAEPAILCIRDGRLICQAKESVSVDGKSADSTATIAVGSHVRVGAVTFAVTRA